MLDSRPKGRGFEPHRRHCVVSLSKNINSSLVLVQPRKTRPFITEKLLMGRKESNQTNKKSISKSIWRSETVVFIHKAYAIIVQSMNSLGQNLKEEFTSSRTDLRTVDLDLLPQCHNGEVIPCNLYNTGKQTYTVRGKLREKFAALAIT